MQPPLESNPQRPARPPVRRKRPGPPAVIGLLIAATLLTRLAWLCVISSNVVGYDIDSWRLAFAALLVKLNPYQFGSLNWPPFWIEMLYCIGHLSIYLGIDFYLAVRLALIIADVVVMLLTVGLLRQINAKAPYAALVLVGYCLNPVPLLITVQQANFDAFVAIWILLFFHFLINFGRGRDAVDWLLAAACLGMGVFTKTTPLLLWPLLVPGLRWLPWRVGVFGGLLVLAPVTLAMAPLYVLNPDVITNFVLRYHGNDGAMGVVGLLHLARLEGVVRIYPIIFVSLILLAWAAVSIALWKRPILPPRDQVLLGALLLLSTFIFGPSYAHQYWFWIVPLLLVCYREFPGGLRAALLVLGIVLSAAFIFDYLTYWSFGGLLYHRDYWVRFSARIQHSPSDLALVRLPVSLTSFAAIAAGLVVWVRNDRAASVFADAAD